MPPLEELVDEATLRDRIDRIEKLLDDLSSARGATLPASRRVSAEEVDAALDRVQRLTDRIERTKAAAKR